MIHAQTVPQRDNEPMSIWNSDFFIVTGSDRAELIRNAEALASQVKDALDSSSDSQAFGRFSLDSFRRLSEADSANQERLGIVATDPADLDTKTARAIKRLADPGCQQINDVTGIYYAAEPLGPDAKIAFLLPGEGSQYVGMMSDLATALPDVRQLLAMCDETYTVRTGSTEESATRFFQPIEGLDNAQRELLETHLRRIDNAMFSVLLGDWVMYRVLESMQLRCDVVAGHSAGELAALMVTGAITGDESQFGKLSLAFRSLGEQQPADAMPSKLIALGKSSEVAQEVLDSATATAGHDLQAFVAMHNCPHQSVIVGLEDDMKIVEAELVSRGMVFQQLVLEQPYHTPLFRPYMRALRQMFTEMPFQQPDIPIYSCTTAALFPNDPEEIRQLTLAHWECPVRFTELISNLHDSGVRCFVEAGPRNNLCSFAEDILRGRDALIVPTNVPRHSGLTQLNHVTARLLANHIQIDPSILFEARGLIEPVSERNFAGSFAEKVDVVRQNLDTLPSGELQLDEVSSDAFFNSVADEAPLRAELVEVADEHLHPTTDVAMQSYLQVMDRFLDTQSEVMQQYLREPAAANPVPGRQPRRSRRGRGNGSGSRERVNRIAGAFADSHPTDHHHALVPGDSSQLPLLGNIVAHDPQQSIMTQRVMDLAEDRFSAHHTVGGRELSEVNPQQHGLPVVPMTFTLEMICEVASALVPGLAVTAVENIRLFKWLAYEGMLSTVQVNAHVASGDHNDPQSEIRVDAQLFQWREDESGPDLNRPAATATVVLNRHFPESAMPSDFPFENQRHTDISLAQLYHNLFHGELFQGVRDLSFYADNGIQGEIETLPREQLLASNPDPQFLFDPILLDVAMHPMCAWHLEQPDQSGRILLPIGIDRIEFFGNRPPVGQRFISRAMNKKETSRQFAYNFDISDSSGNVWCRLTNCLYWRFYLPFSEFNFHGPKNVYMLSTSWDHVLPEQANDESVQSSCRRFEVPTDLQNPTMQPVGAMVTLSDRELAEFQSLELTAMQQTEWLFTRVAAKDAIRDLWHRMTGHRLFSADVEIDFDEWGSAVASLRDRPTPENFPNLAIDRAGMLIGAVASTEQQIGIAVEKTKRAGNTGDDCPLNENERQLCAEIQPDAESIEHWPARIHAARRAVLSCLQIDELPDAENHVQIVAIDRQSGDVSVELSADFAADLSPDVDRRVIPINAKTLAEETNVVATAIIDNTTR